MVIDFLILTSLHFIPKISIFDRTDPYLIFISSGILIVIYIFKKMYYFESYLFWDELVNVIHSVTIYFFIILLLVIVRKNYIDLFKLFVISLSFAMLDAFFRYIYRRFLINFDLLKTNVIILGTGELANMVYDKMKEHPFTMYNFLGFLESDFDSDKIVEKNRIIGSINKINDIIKENSVEEIFIAIPNLSKKDLSEIMSKFERLVRKIKYIPDLYGLMSFSTQIQDLDGILTITAVQELLNPINKILKRFFDILGALIGVIFLIPLTVFVWIGIKLEDNGPVFFRQKRIGQDGKEFYVLKFRTMIVDAEKRLKEMMERDPKIKEEYLKYKKLKNDPRITKIGKFLRKTSLDEFPQFINVLMGDMSVVGPRPYLPAEKNDMKESYHTIIKVKPGITGMWQVSGRNELNFEERLKLDEYYVRNWSLWLDAIILLKTVKTVITKKGAY
ncbi:hypothetical protein XO10_06090 [Marinitoga sp. 1135]|nr:hypothetical protein [Marinitoga sp. 1135]